MNSPHDVPMITVPERIMSLGAKLLPVISQDAYLGTPNEQKGKAPRKALRHGRLEAVDAEELDLFPGESYGIRLDPYFLCVDFDHIELDADNVRGKLPQTLKVKTPRGEHWIFRVPQGKRVYGTKKAFGELLHNAYIVGPNSVINGKSYAIVNDVDPVEAPSWLCEMMATDLRALDGQMQVDPLDGFDKYPQGGRDNNLTALAGYLRNVGFNAPGIEKVLNVLIDNDCVEQPLDDPIRRSDTRRIATSIGKKERGYDGDEDIYVGGSNLLMIDELPKDSEVQRWLLFRYVPENALVMLYGKGGVGKSRWLAYLAARATRKGHNVAIFMHEDDPRRFGAQHRASGGDNSRLYSARTPLDFRFPSKVDLIEEEIKLYGLRLLVLDAVYSHFDPRPGENAAEKARSVLDSLTRVAQANRCTIIGNFHENKAGGSLGSAEMANVARVLLHATKTDPHPFRVEVDKSNFKYPDNPLEYEVREIPYIVNHETQEVKLEEQEDGTLAPEMLAYFTEGTKASPVIIAEGELMGERKPKAAKQTAPALSLP